MVMREYNKNGECDYVCNNNNKSLRYFLQFVWNRMVNREESYTYMFVDNKKKFVEFGLSNGRKVIFSNLPLENGHISLLDLPDFDEEVK